MGSVSLGVAMKYLLPLFLAAALAGCATYPTPVIETFHDVREDSIVTTVRVCEGPRKCAEHEVEIPRNVYMAERRGKKSW